MEPVILVTNDDGIDSQGLISLADSLRALGRVVIVAPDRQQSAVSHALTLHRPLRVTKIKEDFYTIDGTPTDCVNLSINGLLSVKLNLVVSGINSGANMGDDMFYSGTVAAAREAALLKVSAFAISVEMEIRKGLTCLFKPAANFARNFAKYILANPPEPMVYFNVNVPNLPQKKIKGVKVTRQGKRIYGGESIIHKKDPRGRDYFWIGGADVSYEPLGNSDIEAVYSGYISVTPLYLDMTHYPSIERVGRALSRRGWLSEAKQ